MNPESNNSLDELKKNVRKKIKLAEECIKYMKNSLNKEDITVFLNYYYYANKYTIDSFMELKKLENDSASSNEDYSTALFSFNKRLYNILRELTMYYMESVMLANIVTEEKWNEYLKLMQNINVVNGLDDKNELELWKQLKPHTDEELNKIFNTINDINLAQNNWYEMNKSLMLSEV